MKTYSNKMFKQEMGLQLGLIRRQLKKPIELVAEETHLHPMTIDYIEMGESVSWKKYFQLVSYYGARLNLFCLMRRKKSPSGEGLKFYQKLAIRARASSTFALLASASA